ncbi:MAG: efflux RND transporter periplasmic adaptor subunit [Pseudomonadota bacterium]
MTTILKKCALGVALFALVRYTYAADVEARIDWGRRVPLSTAFVGVVIDLPIAVGQHVKKGQLLLRLDQRALRAQGDAARAELDYRDAALKEAQLEQQRANELNERKMLAEHELAMVNIALLDARRLHAAAQAALANAEYALTYSEIRAPFDGMILARAVEAGQFVQTGLQVTPLVEIGESVRLTARANISAAQAARVSVGSVIAISVGGKRVSAVVNELIAAQNKDKWALTVNFDPAGTNAAVGMKASVHLP